MASFWQKLVAQINPFDQGATWKNPTPQRKPAPQPQPRVNLQQFQQAMNQQRAPFVQPRPSPLPIPQPTNAPTFKLGNLPITNPVAKMKPGKESAFDLGVQRGLIGIAQAGSGLYDLVSPGKGTNRVSQNLNRKAQNIDKKVASGQVEGGKSSYLAGQIGINLATLPFGGEFGQGAKAAIKTVPYVSKGTEALNATIRALESGGPSSKIAANVMKNTISPRAAGYNIAATGAYAGSESGKGRKVTPGMIATTLGAGAVIGAGAPLVNKAIGAAGNKVVAGVTRAGQRLENAKLPRPVPMNQYGGVGANVPGNAGYNLSKEEKAFLKKNNISPDLLAKGQLVGPQGNVIQPPVPKTSKITQPTDALGPLKQEALKYKTSQEFNNALTKGTLPENVTRLWHATTSDAAKAIENNGFVADLGKNSQGMTKAKGVWFFPEFSDAWNFSESNVPSFKNQNTKVIKAITNGKIFKLPDDLNLPTSTYLTPPEIEKLKKQGYIGVSGKEGMFAGGKLITKDVVFMFDGKDVMGQNQLNNLYKQAHAESKATSKLVAKEPDILTPPPNASKQTQAAYVNLDKQVQQPNMLKYIVNSASGFVSQHGDSGAMISRLLDTATMNKKKSLQNFANLIPDVLSLHKKDFTKFVDTLDALSRGEKIVIDKKIAPAIEQWNKSIPLIRQRALNAGLDVGDLGPNYFPRIYKDLNNNKNINMIANRLVNEGKAKNFDQAIKMIRQAQNDYTRPYGNLERNRLKDFGNYEKNHEALLSYLNRSMDRITKAEQFGAKNEKLNNLVGNVAREGYDVGPSSQFTRALDVSLQNIDKSTPGHKVADTVKKFNAATQLSLAGVSNATQPVNTLTIAGIGKTLKGLSRYGVGYVSQKLNLNTKSRNALERAVNEGTVLEHSINDISQQITGSKGKIASNVISPLFRSVERFNRTHSAIVAEMYGNGLAKKAAKGSKRAERLLREQLGVKGKIGDKLSPLQITQATHGLDKAAQFHVDPKDIPGWADSPLGKIVFQFSQYPYKQTSFLYNHVLREATKGNVAPLLRFLAVAPAIGYGSSEVRRKISGQPANPDETLLQKYGRGLNAVGGFGLVGGLAQDVKYNLEHPNTLNTLAGMVGGPTGSTIAEFATGVDRAMKGQPKSLEKSAVRRIPLAGKVIAGRAFPSESALIKQKVAEGKFNELTPEQKLKATYTNPDEQKFVNLTDKQQQEAIKKNPELQGLYDRIQADKVHFRDDKKYPGLDSKSAATLNKFNKMTKQETEDYLNKNKSAEFEKDVANYNLKKTQPGWDKIKEANARNELAKSYVGRNFDKPVRDAYSLSKVELSYYLQSIDNPQDVANQLIAYDKALQANGATKNLKYKKGISVDGETLASGSGGSGGGSGGGKAAKAIKIKPLKFKTPKVKLGAFTTPKTKAPSMASVKIPKGAGRVKKIKISKG